MPSKRQLCLSDDKYKLNNFKERFLKDNDAISDCHFCFYLFIYLFSVYMQMEIWLKMVWPLIMVSSIPAILRRALKQIVWNFLTKIVGMRKMNDSHGGYFHSGYR